MAPLRTGLAALAATSALLAAGLVLPAPASAAPAVGSCFDYPFSTLGKASSAAPAIGCEFPHTAETWFVGTVPESFGPPSKASQADRLLAARPCTTKAMNAALGMPTRVLPSRYRTVVLFPTDAQWNAGERWVRCDAALQSGLQFQSTTGTAAAFVAASAQETLNFCTPSTPSARNTAAVQCTKPNRNWIKVLDRELGGANSRFPGTNTVLRRSALICQKIAKKYNGKAEYPGWWRINPTEQGWRLGKRSVQCFVPLAQYLQEVAQSTPAPAPAPAPTPSPAA